MFSRKVYNASKFAPIKPTVQQLSQLNNLIKLCNSEWYIDNSAKSKQLLELGVITVTDGIREECYPFLDLVIYRLPPILLSNNMYFLRGFKSHVHVGNPLEMLVSLVRNYYSRVKHQSITI